MACKYHPNAAIAGKCVECGNEFCRECGVQFTHGTKCLDCAAEYANKKIGQSYIAAGIGFVFGLIGVSQGGWMILAPILMAYVFFSTFWGWQYGGRLWPWLARLTDKIEGEDWQNVAIFFLLTIRFAFSYLVGIFGGGIAGFLWCRGIVAKQLSMEMQRPMSPEMQRPMSEIFAPEEYEWEQGEEEGDEEFEGVTEVLEPKPEPALAQAPEEKPAPPVEVTAEAKSPEEIRKKIREIMGVPLNRQNIRNGVILSVILERPTPRRRINSSQKNVTY